MNQRATTAFDVRTAVVVIPSFKWSVANTTSRRRQGMTASYNVISRGRGHARVSIKDGKCLKDAASARALSVLDARRALEDLRGDVKNVKALLTRDGKGGLLIGLGLAFIAFPEPLFSNITGATLVALGRAFQRRSSSIEDLAEALREITRFLDL